MNPRPFLLAILLGSVSLHAESPKALPVDSPAPAAPLPAFAFVNVVTFNIQADGATRALTVTSSPTMARIDVPHDRMSVIYNPETEYYIGLEHSNYTYWDFTWPQVRGQVQSSKRYEARLRDLGPEVLDVGGSPHVDNTNTPPATATAGPDSSGYVWHSTLEKKRIAGLDCLHWVGETVAGENIDAWCATRPVPQVETAMATLRAINEPMALVPVRNLVPPLVFVAWDALTKGGVTPVLISWGQDHEKNLFALKEEKTRDGKRSLFEVPKVYMKTTLVTMDGIGDQKATNLKRPSSADRPLP